MSEKKLIGIAPKPEHPFRHITLSPTWKPSEKEAEFRAIEAKRVARINDAIKLGGGVKHE